MSHDEPAPGGTTSDVREEAPPSGSATDRAGAPAGAAQGRRPSFSITDAALACAVSRKTITRKLPELATHGAAKDDDGVWQIPVEALLALGLHPGRSMAHTTRPPRTVDLRGEAAEQARPEPAGPDVVTVPRERWDDLRIRLARAEAEASERALALADARLALRALTAGPAAPPDAGAELRPGTERTVPRPAPDGPHEAIEGPRVGAPLDGDGLEGGRPGVVEGGDSDLFSARSHAARYGYPSAPPAAPTEPARRRRWWQAR